MNATDVNMDRPTENLTTHDLPEGQDRYFTQMLKATDDCIAHHPWGAVGVAAVCGLILGLLIGGSARPRRGLE